MDTKCQHSTREPELLNHPLITHDAFKKKMKAIMSVPKAELDARLNDDPLPPQKRGPKPKGANGK